MTMYPDITDEKITRLLACCEKQAAKIDELRESLLDKTRRLDLAQDELRELRARLDDENRMRPSLEVLQRMANGLDPFDRGRFQAAMAALPHETPKLSATISAVGSMGNIGDRLDRARRQQIEASGLRVVEGDPAA